MTGLGNLVTIRTCLSSARSYRTEFGRFGDDLNCEWLVLLEPDMRADINVRFVTDCGKSVTERTYSIVTNLALCFRSCDTVTPRNKHIEYLTCLACICRAYSYYRKGLGNGCLNRHGVTVGSADLLGLSPSTPNQTTRNSFFSPPAAGFLRRFAGKSALSGRARSLLGVCPAPGLARPSAGRMRGHPRAYLADVHVIEAEWPATGPRATSGSSGGGGGLNPCELASVTLGQSSAKNPRLLDRIWGDCLIFVCPVRGDWLRCRFQGLLSQIGRAHV